MKPSASPPPAGAAPRPPFPVRVAGIDAGSNALRLLAAEFEDPARYTRLAMERGSVRLGEDVFRTGRLGAAVMDAAVETFARFRRRMEEVGVTRYRAVTTSAMRESANREEFLERVRREAGIELEVISGTAEAALVHRAVGSRVPLEGGEWMVVDVGGGSTEVSRVGGSEFLLGDSYAVGAVRLLRELPPAEEDLDRFRRLLAEYVAGRGLSPSTDQGKLTGLIAIGGNIEALARLTGKEDRGEGAIRLALDPLRGLIARLAGLTLAQRIAELGLRPDRADVILPAALLYEHLARLAGVEEVVVPWVGVREGILYELVAGVLRERGTPPAPTPAPPS